MKCSAFKTTLVISIIALAILLVVWWVNGREDTWLFISSAIIVLSALSSASPRKKDKEDT